MPNLERAIQIAVAAHAGQTDKVGNPYILHTLTVMFKLSTEAEMIVGVLHDVIEDTDVDAKYLREQGFSNEIVSAIQAMTHADNESYEDYVQRVSENPIAIRVKLADLEHNMDVRRLTNSDLNGKFDERIRRYHKAWHFLTEKLKNAQ